MTDLTHPFHAGPLRRPFSRPGASILGGARISTGDREDAPPPVQSDEDAEADTVPDPDPIGDIDPVADSEAGHDGLAAPPAGEQPAEPDTEPAKSPADRTLDVGHHGVGDGVGDPEGSDGDATQSSAGSAMPDVPDSDLRTGLDRTSASEADQAAGTSTGGFPGVIRVRGRKVAVRRAGETKIADEVIEKVAGIAARKVTGVHDLTGRRNGGARRGISAQLSGRRAKLSVTLIVEYGHAVYDVADQVRESLADTVERMLGVEVTEVDVVVEDIHLPGQDV